MNGAFFVTGDLTEPDLDIEPQMAQNLRECVTKVFHSGAEIGFQKDEKELLSINCKRSLRWSLPDFV
jgi:thioester reductase-like protein